MIKIKKIIFIILISAICLVKSHAEIKDGLFKDSIIPIGSLLATRYFISLQLIGLIIVACVIGSIAVTKNTIENDEEGDVEAI